MSADSVQLLPPADRGVGERERKARKLGRIRERHLAYVERLDRKVLERHTAIVSSIALAAEIDDGSPKPEGWTDREYRVAQDARRGPREAPMYLQTSAKIVDSYKKAAAMAERDPAPVLNCDIQVFVNQSFSYPVRDTDKDRDG